MSKALIVVVVIVAIFLLGQLTKRNQLCSHLNSARRWFSSQPQTPWFEF